MNIGKNRDTAIENAGDDYEFCFTRVAPVADYVTLNLALAHTTAFQGGNEGINSSGVPRFRRDV